MEHYETSALEDLNIKLIFHKASLQTMERIKNNTISINKDVATRDQGAQGVKANIAYKEGKFLPAHYQEEMRKNGVSVSLRQRDENQEVQCKLCCE
jgi:hypothetical protein